MPRRPVRSRLPGPSTRASALSAGLSDGDLRHRDVVRLSRDTYLPRSADADLAGRLSTILLTAPEGAVVSHHTAAALWRVEIPLVGRQPAHLTVPPGSRARHRRHRTIHRAVLDPGDVVQMWGPSR